ncbi:hypothetical protein AVEN_249386-1 [Araneus ventricosus]|uniref:RNA-directed DNA polymerase n=1 Tax=Araneus ventricosus TaxID=182803 RepID=A0A4Y2VZ19_ARAVE|nr:hypothetical protein AVEN_249386-1 [Araneus ventricosus]
MVTCSRSEITRKIATAQEADERIHLLKTLVEKGLRDDHLIKENVLYLHDGGRELIFVPEAMELEIIRGIHKNGHFAAQKTEDLLKRDFYISNVKMKIEQVITNCVECILCNRKRGKEEAAEALQKFKIQQAIFANPSRIISDKGSAFTSKDFEDYCKDKGIQHIQITTGVPRANGQIERMHGTHIPVLAKLSVDDPAKWFKFAPDVQRIINSTVSRSAKFTPFELMTGVKMRNKDDLKIKEILDEEYMNSIIQEKETIREEAKANIFKVQEENRRKYNRRRATAPIYKINDLVAIKRTQLGGGLKLKPKFLGPYKVVKIKPHDRYDVAKVGSHEGPAATTTSADHMKPWSDACSEDLTCRWPSVMGFVPVTARWRRDSHTVTALCHSESEVRRGVRSDGKGKLSRRRLQLPLAPAKKRFQISMSSN